MDKIAIAQIRSTADIEDNCQQMEAAIAQAITADTKLIAFPENCLYLGRIKSYNVEKQQIVQQKIERFQTIARDNALSILLGSVFESASQPTRRFYNTSILINHDGCIAGKYRKIHLFDIDIPGLSLRESDDVLQGDKIVTISHDICKFGLTICYDVRFPSLFQRLRLSGAELIFVPAAFTVPTGKAHWLTLLKARAIENQVYIAAPAQFGKHSSTRKSYGKSVLVDPWGDIVSIAEDGVNVIIGDIDLNKISMIRRQMPISNHLVNTIDII